MTTKCESTQYAVLMSNGESYPVFPYLRSLDGDKKMCCLSPNHGRSYVVGRLDNGRYVVSKGNGLSYTQCKWLNTGEMGDDTLGLLLRKDAERDFTLGNEIAKLGIKTNHMEYVLELDREVLLQTGHILKPVLLQYDVECPWRINDACFMPQKALYAELAKWEKMNDKGFEERHMIAADILIHNLRILHDHGILHNAIHEQNYTWALELLDFELACSPAHPYEREDYRRHVKDLFAREITQTYNLINYIAYVLKEPIDYARIDRLFDEYGFDIEQYAIL